MIDNEYIPVVNNSKCLRLLIDKYLNWHLHIEKIIIKMNRDIYMLRQVQEEVNNDSIKNVLCFYKLAATHRENIEKDK